MAGSSPIAGRADPATRQALAAEPAFWSISAQIHHQSGQQSQALAAAEQALALTPQIRPTGRRYSGY